MRVGKTVSTKLSAKPYRTIKFSGRTGTVTRAAAKKAVLNVMTLKKKVAVKPMVKSATKKVTAKPMVKKIVVKPAMKKAKPKYPA